MIIGKEIQHLPRESTEHFDESELLEVMDRYGLDEDMIYGRLSSEEEWI